MKATRWILVLILFTAACGSGPTQPGLEDVGSENGASLLGDMVQPPGDEGSNPDAPTNGASLLGDMIQPPGDEGSNPDAPTSHVGEPRQDPDVGSENGASLLNDMVQPPGDEGSNAEAVAAGI